MHRGSIALALLFAAMFSMRAPAAGQRFRVCLPHGKAALRTLPDAAGEVVASLGFGSEVTAPDAAPDDDLTWVRVVVPDEVSLWVYADLVRDGRIVANNVQARSGAGINYKPVVALQRGTEVETRGRLGDWMRIKAPSGAQLWMARADLEPLAIETAPEEADGEALPDAADAAAGEAAAGTPAAPAEFRGYTLSAGQGQGIMVLRQGRVDWPSLWERNVPAACVYSLVDAGGQATLLLVDRTTKMGEAFGQQVVVSGALWHLDGVALPVLVANEVKTR